MLAGAGLHEPEGSDSREGRRRWPLSEHLRRGGESAAGFYRPARERTGGARVDASCCLNAYDRFAGGYLLSQ